eukprot:TRINITY_DN10168_c0_g1_i1.p1 TRINITY_DN10168_c0_g1~~TRINITY_DN10168_c0_g1_i1.p1  ORF type:complete len:127 (+),score=22.47 TRINITY_DN10168_c0_g1_i1:130-510(+)
MASIFTSRDTGGHREERQNKLHQIEKQLHRGELPEIPSFETLEEYRVPFGIRDRCSALVLLLNECRFENFYLPWKCGDTKHAWEVCKTIDYHNRLKAKMHAAGHKDLSSAARTYKFFPSKEKSDLS